MDSRKYSIAAGDIAIVCIACPCGYCPLCLTGDDANCVNMKVTNSGIGRQYQNNADLIKTLLLFSLEKNRPRRYNYNIADGFSP